MRPAPVLPILLLPETTELFVHALAEACSLPALQKTLLGRLHPLYGTLTLVDYQVIEPDGSEPPGKVRLALTYQYPDVEPDTVPLEK